MEGREEFVAKVRDLIWVTQECVDGLPHYLMLLAFPIILEYLIQDMDPEEE